MKKLNFYLGLKLNPYRKTLIPFVPVSSLQHPIPSPISKLEEGHLWTTLSFVTAPTTPSCPSLHSNAAETSSTIRRNILCPNTYNLCL